MQVYQGYQLIFFTQQNRKLEGMTVAEWLLKTAKDLGIPGATMSLAQGGYGRDGKFHSAHFFELAEVPEEVLMAVTEEECDGLFAEIDEAKLEIFYTKSPIEFGLTGQG